MAIAQSLQQPEQGRELAKIARRTSPAQLQVNDEVWREYWFRMNGVMGRANDPQMKQALILVSAYGGASLLLLAAPWTPALRHWWILLPCVYYVFVTTGQAIMGYAKSQDPEQLFSQQWQYLQDVGELHGRARGGGERQCEANQRQRHLRDRDGSGITGGLVLSRFNARLKVSRRGQLQGRGSRFGGF